MEWRLGGHQDNEVLLVGIRGLLCSCYDANERGRSKGVKREEVNMKE